MTAKNSTTTKRQLARNAPPMSEDEVWAYLESWDRDADAMRADIQQYAQEWDAMAEAAAQSSRKPTTTR